MLRLDRHKSNDIEALDGDGDDQIDSPFDIHSTKYASTERLKRWRQSALVLNASRRFRYTLDLKKEEEKLQMLRQIRSHARAIRSAYLFRVAREQVGGIPVPPPTPVGEFLIGPEQLVSMSRDQNMAALEEYGGVKGLGEKLKTNLENGIHGEDEELLERRSVFRSNTYPPKKSKSIWTFLREAGKDLTLIILMVSGIISLGLGIATKGIKKGCYDGGGIVVAVVLVIMVTAISDYKESLQFNNMIEEKRNIHSKVMRGGRRIEVSIYDIVVGDIVLLSIGDQVPADGVLISGYALAIDESSMTGESKIVGKSSRYPFLMSGCKVEDGRGSMLVTSVGIDTEWGLLMASISEDTGEETPLQVRLNGVATFFGKVGLSVAIAVLHWPYKNPDGSVQFSPGKTKASDAINGAVNFVNVTVGAFVGDAIEGVVKVITVAAAIIVVAVPEGLPLAIILILAYSMVKMMRDKVLLRRLSACETMGSATTICMDKTGTLTLNQMTVIEAYAGGKKIDSPDSSPKLSPLVSSLLFEGIALNTDGSVYVPVDGGDSEVSGSPTEKAVLSWGIKIGMNFDVVRSESSIIHVFPFNSDKKRGGVAVQLPDSQVRLHWKGAAEIVLASCTAYLDSSDDLVTMNEEKESYFKRAIETMAAASLRCVALAYRTYDKDKVPSDEEDLSRWVLPEDDLVLLAIVGIKDPCRPGIQDAVQLCQNAGVKVRMVTGDSPHTARAIALECGILKSDADATEIIEGKNFRSLTEVEREEVAVKISVMGRSSPNDKLLLVQALKRRGHVVAVTGDGTNDAPALHEADVGLAMGIQGTEVAKESSDIIIMDDNFTSIMKLARCFNWEGDTCSQN